MMLLLMAVAGRRAARGALVEVVNHLSAGVINLRATDIAAAFGAVDMFGDRLPRIGLMTAFAQQNRAIAVSELDHVMVKNLTEILLAESAAALALCRGRVIVLDPIDDVEIVNVLLDDVVAADPQKVIPVAHLVLHFGLPILTALEPRLAAVPISAGQDNVANGAVLKRLDSVHVGSLVPPLQADGNRQPFLLCFFVGGEKFANAGCIDGHWLL